MESATRVLKGASIAAAPQRGATFTPHQPRPRYAARRMIDNFALGLSHGLMLLAAWLLLRRDDLDREPSARDRAGSRAGRRPRA